MDLADEIGKWGYSWHHWAYKLYGAWTWDSHGLFNLGDDNNYNCPDIESCLNVENVKTYARVYPSAVAGTGKYFHFDDETNEAVLVYQPDPSIESPTEIRVPVKWRYQNGVSVNITPEGVTRWNFLTPNEGLSSEEANSTLAVHLEDSWNGEEISVVITP